MDDSIIGTTVDGYHIQELVGRGGMGVVYKARDVSLAREVALKCITPELANDEPFLRRFRSEAQALARLESPYIVSVYALRQTDIGLLIVMEYVEGGTLKDLTRAGPMDWQEALPFIEQMLTALEHAHGADVIHRDIKPHNILLGQRGTVKVTDFGLAKVYHPDSDQTVTQGVHGTLKYMSPEQVEGRADLDHRSDLYSLGMTVYEMVAGRLPFDEYDSEFTIMQRIVGGTLPRPDRYQPEIPDAFVRLIMKSLAKDPDDRFESARSMREAFEAAAARQEETADTNTADVVRAVRSRTAGRSRIRAVGVGFLMILLILGGYVTYEMMMGGQAPNANQPTENRSSGSATALSIDTKPTGATVYQGRRRIGVTPLTYTVEDDSAQLRVRKEGFVPLDTSLGLGSNQTAALTVRLTRDVPTTNLAVVTEPSGATVYLDGDRVGTTPAEYTVEGDEADLRVQKKGYAPVDTVPTLAGTSQVRLDLELSEVDAENPPSPQGRVDLAARPTGTVVVGEQRYDGSAAVQLPVGRHRVRFQHPEYGTKDTTITVRDAQTHVVTCYFEHAIRVRGPDDAGTIVLDGSNTQASPPHEVLRGPGTHRVTLQIRDSLQTVSGGLYRRMVEEREIQRADFSGRTVEVPVTPSFAPATHIVTFRVKHLADRVRERVDGLARAMRRAIEQQKWELLPGPLAESCKDALEALYSKHEITAVRVVSNEVARRGGTVELPFETYITYHQKGREGTKYIPLSIVTVWASRNGAPELVDVRRTDVGGK